jgi:hypothetical protein
MSRTHWRRIWTFFGIIRIRFWNQDSEFVINENDKKNRNSYESEKNRRVEEFNYFLNENEYHIEIELIVKSNTHQCRKCKANFSFNNKLHHHIRECRQKLNTKIVIDSFHVDKLNDRVIVFKTKSNLIKSLTFRSWHFVIFHARTFENESLNKLCANSECIMSLIDRTYLLKVLSNIKIHQTKNSVIVREIEIATHNCFEYVSLELLISNCTKISFSNEIEKLTRQAHVVNNLRAKFLMSMNILRFEEMILNISRRKLIMSLYENLETNIQMTSKIDKKRIDSIILTERLVSISAKFIAFVSIRMKDTLFERDYLF